MYVIHSKRMKTKRFREIGWALAFISERALDASGLITPKWSWALWLLVAILLYWALWPFFCEFKAKVSKMMGLTAFMAGGALFGALVGLVAYFILPVAPPISTETPIEKPQKSSDVTRTRPMFSAERVLHISSESPPGTQTLNIDDVATLVLMIANPDHVLMVRAVSPVHTIQNPEPGSKYKTGQFVQEFGNIDKIKFGPASMVATTREVLEFNMSGQSSHEVVVEDRKFLVTLTAIKINSEEKRREYTFSISEQ
jgi:ABC-type multidrug transport system fused ATPase/permease subunit